MNKKILSYGLSAIVLLSMIAMAIPVSAQIPMADEFGVEDAMGNLGDYVEVPVNIENTTNGPIENIAFYISYDKTVLNLTDDRIEAGVLTSDWWVQPEIGVDKDLIRLIGMFGGTPIANGSTGTVAILNFSVIGTPESYMNLSGITLKNVGGVDGFVPADGVNNGTFRVDAGAPSVTNPNANPDTIVADGVQESELSVTVSDDIAIHDVTLDLTPIGGELVHMNNVGNYTVGDVVWCIFNYTTNASIGTPPGIYHLQVNATDLLGNYNNTVSITLNVTSPPTSTIIGKITYACNGTGIPDVIVNLTQENVVASTTTDSEGNYTFTDVTPGDYYVNASKPKIEGVTGFWDNSTDVTVTAGVTTTADTITLWLKGDLNNNCESADKGDVLMIFDAYMGVEEKTERHDLNENGVYADKGDVLMMFDAYMGVIVLE